MTVFARFLKDKNISAEQAAKELGIAKPYVYMLAAGTCTPSFHLAIKAEVWSGGVLTMQSWAPKVFAKEERAKARREA